MKNFTKTFAQSFIFFKRLSVTCLILLGNISFAQTSGIFESYAILSLNGGANTFYDMQATTVNPDFQGANLGTFVLGTNTLVLKGGQNKTFKNGSCNILNSSIWYRIYRNGVTPGGFTSINEPFDININGGARQERTYVASLLKIFIPKTSNYNRFLIA